ncbi:MAG: AAA family ATPase, partial [Paracraurococcus sp.]
MPMPMPGRGTERQASPGTLSERKLVTILFADIVDSLRALEGVDPEEAHALFSATLGAMAQAVRAYGGSVANTMGDGIMAVFGAPLAQEDHAMRACHAALLLHDWAAGIRPGSGRVALRVGLHSGEVAIGTAPAEISATGAAVHIASRLQQLAAPGRTVLSAETRMLVQAEMLTEPLGRFALKGLERSVDLHRLLGPLPAQPRPEHRRQAPFVGRGAPLAALLEAHAAALQGRGALLAVSGEAGIGKTTLVERFLAARPPTARLVRGAAERYLSAAPFQPLRALMLDLLELHQVAPEERRAALLARLQVLDLAPETSAPPLLELFDLASADAEWARLGAQQRRARMAASFAELLLRESRHCPLLVVLEDLQWADSATIDLLGLLARQLGTHGILLLLTHRPEFQPPWADSPIFRALRLDHLDEEETRALIRHQAGAGLLPLLERRLLALSRGNPLFLRESINALIEAGMVAPGPAGTPAATLPDPETIAIPRSVTAVIAERIDRLAPEAKAVLLAASVIGAQFSLDLLARLTREPPERLPEQIRILERAEFLRSVDPEAGLYAFDHALFQEVGYATLLKAHRRRLHEAAFLALRQRQREPEAAQVESLAFHALHGELWEEAFRLCWRAGRRAAARYAHREAAHHLENALHALDQADPDGLRLESALELRLELRAASLPLLRLDRVGGLLEEARQLAQRLGHRDQLARITGFLAGHAYLTRSAKPSEALCREALQLCREGTDPYLRIAPSLYLAQALYGLGRYGEVLRVLNPVLRGLDAGLPGAALGLPVRPLLMGWYWLAITQAELGRFAPARQLCERMLTIADELLPFEYI